MPLTTHAMKARERKRDPDRYKRRINECGKEMMAIEIQLNVSLTRSHSQGSVRTQPAGMGNICCFSTLMKLGLKRHSFVLSLLTPLYLFLCSPFSLSSILTIYRSVCLPLFSLTIFLFLLWTGELLD